MEVCSEGQFVKEENEMFSSNYEVSIRGQFGLWRFVPKVSL